MHGAKSFRHVYLFEKGVIICKKREDGAMSCKTSIMVSHCALLWGEVIVQETTPNACFQYDDVFNENIFGMLCQC